MTKKNYLITLFSTCFWTYSIAQTSIDHPLNKTNMIVNDAEIAVIHTLGNGNNNIASDYFDYDPKLAVNARIKSKNTGTVGTTGSPSMKSVNTVTLDFDGDKFDDIVYVYQNNNKGITIAVPQIDRKTLKTNSTQSITVSNGATAGYVPRMRLGKADFDRDGKDELVLAFRYYPTEKTTIQIYKIAANGTPSLQTEIADITFGFLGGSWEEDVYDITINDFDGDSIPDIALANLLNVSPNNDFKIYTYSVSTKSSWSITAKGNVVVGSGGSLPNYKIMALSSGLYNIKKPNQRQITLAVAYIDPSDNQKIKRQLFIASTPSFKTDGVNALNTITVAANPYTYSDFYNNLPSINLKSGDLDQNFTDEIVFAFGTSFDIFTTDSNLVITKKGNGGAGTSSGDFYKLATGSYLDIADVDKDFIQDIIIGSTYDDGNNFHYLSLSIFDAKAVVNGNNPVVYNLGSLNTKGSSSTLLKASYGGASDDYFFALAFGDFDGGKGRLGAPTHFVKKLLTPLVVVNTPPYHFDNFSSKNYDITSCFPNYQCAMNSAYSKATTSTGTIETTLKSDWAVSAKISAGGSIGALGLSASLKGTYGESFDKTNSNTTKTSITSDQIAKGDDWIFADVTDYDIYEYPIDSNGFKIGYVLAKMRRSTGTMNVWMESKSPDALYYIPDHEVGNVMSYPSFSTFAGYAGGLQNIKGSPGGSCNIGSTTNTSFSMQYSDFASSSASTTTKFGIEASASASIYGFSLETEGSYNSSDLISHTSTASNEIKYTSNFTSTLDNSINPAPNYTLTPYVYWGKNGAITLGYSVDPSNPGGITKTFWSEYYGKKPDLTLILPWRLDSAKGLKATFIEDQPRFCKSIIINKDQFITGDTVGITAWIQNFSFVDYNGTADFEFYLGAPKSDGSNKLTDINGKSMITVTGNFPGRGRVPVQFNWRIPPGLQSFPKIYVVIDPKNTIDEGHEDNNIGFNVANSAGISLGNRKINKSNSTFSVKLTPNPAGNSGTDVNLTLPTEGYLNVELRDMTGKVIKKLYDSDQKSWAGSFILPVKTSDLIQGIYFVTITFNGQQQAVKLIKLD